MSKAVIRVEKVKTVQEMVGRERHNTRGKADTKDNPLVVVEGVKNVAKAVQNLTKELNKKLKANGKGINRKDAVQLAEIVISSDGVFFESNDYEKYFTDASEFIEQFFGEESVTHAKYTHLDETTQHQHIFISPIFNGRYSWSHFLNKKQDFSKLQQDFYTYMTKEKGYKLEERILAKDSKKQHQRAVEWSKQVNAIKDKVIPEMSEEEQGAMLAESIINTQRIEVLENRVVELRQELDHTEQRLEEVTKCYNTLGDHYRGLRRGLRKVVKNSKDADRQIEQLEKIGMQELAEEEKAKRKQVMEQDNGMEI